MAKEAISNIKKPTHLLSFDNDAGVESIIRIKESVDIMTSSISEPNLVDDIEEDTKQKWPALLATLCYGNPQCIGCM